jgi:hypothetical protein
MTVLAYEFAGLGPAVLLVHAGIADRRMWDDQVDPFAGAGRVGTGRPPVPGAGPVIADVLAAGIPGAERVVLDGTAHLPSMERPVELNRVVLEFLAELDRSP